MSLTMAEVERIAHLARLDLSAEEIAQYREQLSAVLDYASLLDELDLADIQPTAHAVTRRNIMREDVVEPSLPIDEVLFNVTWHEQNQFAIQPVLDE